MGVKTVRYCDSCGKEIRSSRDHFPINVVSGKEGARIAQYGERQRFDLCELCAKDPVRAFEKILRKLGGRKNE